MNRTVDTEVKELTGVIDLQQDAPGAVVITTDEYRQLVSNQARLDMILMTRASRGYYSDDLIRIVHDLRAAEDPSVRVWAEVQTGVDENGEPVKEMKLVPELKGGDVA